jgi:ribosomal protein S12 methylthiotransferase accessory factor YcaO
MCATATARCCSPTARAVRDWRRWPAPWANSSSACPATISGRTTTSATSSPIATFAHYPREQWFRPGPNGEWPEQLLTPELRALYIPTPASMPTRWWTSIPATAERGICALPYIRQRDGATVWFPVNLIGNLYVSNGMSAGNTEMEARTQALSEILERHIKFRIISEGPLPAGRAGGRHRPLPAHRRRHTRACARPVSASWSRMPRSAANTR